MCHEYEGWWRAEDIARRRAERPMPVDTAKPKPEPRKTATPRPEVRADEEELVPAE
ncbi:MAG TPA: hypothetical protein VFK86_21735 [Bauldia sp.]|nr:hypothetical protein [Bauldia sp.]